MVVHISTPLALVLEQLRPKDAPTVLFAAHTVDRRTDRATDPQVERKAG